MDNGTVAFVTTIKLSALLVLGGLVAPSACGVEAPEHTALDASPEPATEITVQADVAGELPAEVQPPTGPTQADRAALHAELDRFLDLRMDAPAGATASLVAHLEATHFEVSDVEALLRAGRAHYPDVPPQTPGAVGTRIVDPGAPYGYDFQPSFQSFDLDGYSYDYTTKVYVYVPTAYAPTRLWPVVFVGHGGNAAMTAREARYAAQDYLDAYRVHLGEELGAIVVAPATERGWGAVGNDIMFTTLARVATDYRVDPDRIFLAGHSMGGHFAWRTALLFGDRFGAVSPQSGGYTKWLADNALANTYAVAGYTTYGTDEPLDLTATNDALADWLHMHNYDWVAVERPGGHEVFDDELPKIAAFFEAHPRRLYRPTVFLRLVGSMQQGDESNEAWTPPTQAIDPARPIRWNTRHWIEVTPRPDVAEPMGLYAENLGDNHLAIRTQGVRHLRVMFHPTMVDLARPVAISVNDQTLFTGTVTTDLGWMLDQARIFADRGRVFYGYVDLDIATDVGVSDPVVP